MIDDSDAESGTDDREIPADVIERAERLTRLAREAVDENEAAAYRAERDGLVGEYDFRARVRDEGSRDVLVLHPEEWLDDGVVRVDRVESVDRGIERPLDAPAADDDWDAIERYNRTVAERVADEHGAVHGENAAAFADFMGNHRARPIDGATEDDVEEFLTEYFPRNAWPSEAQRDAVEESLALAFEVAETTDAAR